jgi:hypothetical protein
MNEDHILKRLALVRGYHFLNSRDVSADFLRQIEPSEVPAQWQFLSPWRHNVTALAHSRSTTLALIRLSSSLRHVAQFCWGRLLTFEVTHSLRVCH